MIRNLIILTLLLSSFAFEALGNFINIGVPYIHNFPKKEYKAGTQNWSITQGQQGFMYFANNSGLLTFDGIKWQLYQMPNSSVVRSVFRSDDGQIYIGAYNELGEIVTDNSGKMKFKSFKRFIPSEFQNFDDIWNITTYKDQIVFQSYNFAFLFKNDSVLSVIRAPSRFQNSYQINGHLYFNDSENGLLEYDSGKLIPIEGSEVIKHEEIWAILPFRGGNNLLIFTLDKGAFICNENGIKSWEVPANSLFKKFQVFSATIIHDNYMAVGTVQDGLLIIDQEGNVLQHINRQKGLQNNTVLKVFADKDKNLWLGLDNGIDYLNINSPITFLQQPEGIGAGYTSIIYKGKIYLGTNQGLYTKDLEDANSNEKFHLIPGTNGQVWYLGIHEDILICGHNNGTFVIEGEKARQISKTQGAWRFMQLKRFPGYLIGGTYDGLIYFKKQNGEWKYVEQIKGFNESFRVFEEDENGNLWMSHGFKGIFMIDLGTNLGQIKSYKYYDRQSGLPSNYNLNIYKIKDRIVVTSKVGLYEYNPKTDQFERSEYFNKLFGSLKDISYLHEDERGNIWYIERDKSKNKAGVLRIQDDNSFKNVTAPFALLSNKFINGFEFIYPYSDGQVMFGTEDGFAHYSQNSVYSSAPEFSAYINQASATYLDSIFYSGNNINSNKRSNRPTYVFPYKDNSFRFSYTSPLYENIDNIEFSYKLIGYNEKWSEWSTTSFNEYAKLPPGTFILNVKAQSQSGTESSVDTLEFTINPPWYLSVYAYVFYAILFVLFVLFIIWFVLKRIEISKRRERLKHLQSYRQKEQEFRRQSLVAEKKIISLKNEKLRIEMVHRDKELANQTMDLIRKNKFLQKLKEDLDKLKKSSSDESLKSKISGLINKIDKDIDHEKQWEVFETAFDEVHEDFLSRLKKQYPNLTPKELKLCAYLRMNISTKEIAPLMNISVRGVEILRYRVRKKLNIDRDQNLTRMIIDL